MSEASCATCALPLTISLFESEHDTRPVRAETTWGDLRARLLRFELRDEKSGPAWSPVSYADGAARGNAGVEKVYVAVMDVDDGTDPAYIISKLHGTYEFIIYSTFSSTPDYPKFRVVVPLANPCSAATWPVVFPRLCALLTEGHTDPATKDPARIYYLPSARPGGRTFTYSAHGRAVLAADLPAPVEPTSPVATGVPLGRDGKLPHGRHYEWLRSFIASFVSRTPGATEAQATEAARAAFSVVGDDLPTHEAEIVTLTRSALPKYGKPAPSVEPARAGPALFAELRERFEQHVSFPEPWEYEIAALYVFECYVGDLLPGYFYLFFDGTKGAGKTTALDHVSRLTDSLRLQSFTLATLSRSITKYRPVSIDEFDEVEKDPEIGGAAAALVRQGYKREAAPRKVCAPKSNEVLDLEIAGPKALTFRGDIDDALKDRGFRLPMAAGGGTYRMVLLSMAHEFGDLATRLQGWGKVAHLEWSFERVCRRLKEPSFEEKVGAILPVLMASRNAELVTTAVLVSEIVGIDLVRALKDAKAAKDRDEGVNRNVEELMDALKVVSGRTTPKLAETETYVVAQKEVRDEIDRARKERGIHAPIKQHEFSRARKDALIRDDWRVMIRGADYWKVPRSFVETGTGGESPETPRSPCRLDVRVTGVTGVPLPLPPEPKTEGEVRAAARAGFDQAEREEEERSP